MNYAGEIGFRWHDMHTKYHKDRFRGSKIMGDTYIDTHTARKSHKPTSISS
jgi:hypothetical protein